MRESLLNYLETFLEHHTGEWINSGAITDDRKWYRRNGINYTSQSVGRALRRLEESSHIAVRYPTQYRYIRPDKRGGYIPVSKRLPGEEDKLFRV